MSLGNRLQILIDDERLARLRSESAQSGAPIGAIVREAIDYRLGSGAEQERQAGFRTLLDEPAPSELEPDWEVVKAEMLDVFAARFDDAS